MRYTHLFFDADGTLFDYDLAEKKALMAALDQAGLPFTDKILNLYRSINQDVWLAFEKGLVDKDTLRSLRFEKLFSAMQVERDPLSFSFAYIDRLSECADLFPGVTELLRMIEPSYHLYIITNGIAEVQHPRLRRSNIAHFFDALFVSEEVGHQKPDAAFFDQVFAKASLSNRQKALVIGDSLSADIQGGINANVDTCWFNPQQQENDTNVKATYEITDYDQLLPIIGLDMR